MVVEGKLFGWFETGLEGTVWALQREGTSGYDGLYIIEEGDHLVITSSTGRELFNDYIAVDTESGKMQRPFSQMIQPQAKGLWIHWTQKGFLPDDWAELFIIETNSGLLTKRGGWVRP
ncbi:MAG: hypothetical protein EOO53_16015 [Gammaproteobacteria bacterium]|nr:MAG: hypothetical protein EOO53_16015 [Gammaproteobacteria bacterium]